MLEGLGHVRLGFDVVFVAEGVVVVEDRELIVLVAAVGLADAVGLFVEGAALSELGERPRDVPAAGGGGLFEAGAVGAVGFEFGIEGEEADEGVNCYAEEGDDEADGKDVEDRAAGGVADEKGNVDDERRQGAETECDG